MNADIANQFQSAIRYARGEIDPETLDSWHRTTWEADGDNHLPHLVFADYLDDHDVSGASDLIRLGIEGGTIARHSPINRPGLYKYLSRETEGNNRPRLRVYHADTLADPSGEVTVLDLEHSRPTEVTTTSRRRNQPLRWRHWAVGRYRVHLPKDEAIRLLSSMPPTVTGFESTLRSVREGTSEPDFEDEELT